MRGADRDKKAPRSCVVRLSDQFQSEHRRSYQKRIRSSLSRRGYHLARLPARGSSRRRRPHDSPLLDLLEKTDLLGKIALAIVAFELLSLPSCGGGSARFT